MMDTFRLNLFRCRKEQTFGDVISRIFVPHALVLNGFCKDVLQVSMIENTMEAQALVTISLEGSVG